MSDAGRASAMSGPRPHMLPPGTDLVGRGDELARLHRFLAQDRALTDRKRASARISIIGKAGVGKSALGTEFAYSLEREYPDGALYVDLNDAAVTGSLDTSQILRNFLQELRRSPEKLPQDARALPAEFVRATDGKRLIVFLDNAKDYQSIKDLVPRSSTCLVIFTSYEHLADVHALHLDPLPDGAAVELFGRIAPSRAAGRAESVEQLVRVLKSCEGLPIASGCWPRGSRRTLATRWPASCTTWMATTPT